MPVLSIAAGVKAGRVAGVVGYGDAGRVADAGAQVDSGIR